MADNGQAFDELRSILLSQDKEDLYRINDDLRHELLNKIGDIQMQLDDPIIFSHKISASKSQIVDILGPVMGRMIKKYIQSEIEKLNAQIKDSTNKITSKLSFFDRFRKRKTEASIKDLEKAELCEILLIGKLNGILLAKYSKSPIADPDLVAGMFTAIKSFMETVFEVEDSEVGMIDYTDYKILLQPYGSYYFAIIFKGINDPHFKTDVVNKLDSFVEQHSSLIDHNKIDNKQSSRIAEMMSTYFNDTYE